MSQFALIKDEMVDAATRPDAFDAFFTAEMWNKFEYLIAMLDIALEELPASTRFGMDERAGMRILYNRSVMRAARDRVILVPTP